MIYTTMYTGLEVFFVNNTPILDVDRVYAEFETNRPDVLIECYLTHLDSRVDCKCLAGSCGNLARWKFGNI